MVLTKEEYNALAEGLPVCEVAFGKKRGDPETSEYIGFCSYCARVQVVVFIPETTWYDECSEECYQEMRKLEGTKAWRERYDASKAKFGAYIAQRKKELFGIKRCLDEAVRD